MLPSLTLSLSVATALTALAVAIPAQADDLTVEALHDSRGLSGPSLRGARFSPDGSMVTVLQGSEEDATKLSLWAYDVESGDARVLVKPEDILEDEVELSEEEKNRRERQRIYQTGIVAYEWDTKGEQILFPLGGDIFTYQLESGTPKQITDTEAFETDPKISPEGKYISYVRDDELVVYDLGRGREKQVTKGATQTIRNAVSDFVSQEELDRDTGYWWSPNDDLIAYTQIDESPVVIAERLDFGPDGSKTIRQRYPFAGTDNVKIKLGVVKPSGGRTTWVDLGSNEDIYIADVHWSKDGQTLYVERLSRNQKTLDLLAVNPKNGSSKVILSETDDVWVNLLGGFRALSDGGFLWESEKTGFNHIYRYSAEGNLVGQLTSGDWPVQGISCFDESDNELYFSGWQESPLENHIFRTSLEGGEINQITSDKGWHTANFGKGCDSYIGAYSNKNQPRQTAVRNAEGDVQFWLIENELDENHPYAPYLDSHEEWEFGTIEAEDGTELYYGILAPSDIKRGDQLPAIQLVYGGPHAQTVRNTWGDHYAQLLVDKGYVVFRLDNRGASNRGKAFEDVLYQSMGIPEVADQAKGTEWLASQPFVDADRIAVQGWSYGGYMVLMMMGQNPDLYTAGIAGAPVTDWRTYDTAYTERYMGDPRIVTDAYDASSPMTYVENIQDDSLLIIHGMADDNVIFQNTIDYMAALQKQGTSFELMTYPGEKHGFRARTNRIHRDNLNLDFFERKLK